MKSVGLRNIREIKEGAGVSDIETGKWCWSVDEERYRSILDTEEEAHAEAKEWLDCDDERERGRNLYWVARTCNPLDSIGADRLGEWIEEQVDCSMADECGAEDYVLEMSEEDKTALGELVIAFIREKGSILYYSVTDVTEHTYVVPEEK
jgi:hypothetical protein